MLREPSGTRKTGGQNLFVPATGLDWREAGLAPFDILQWLGKALTVLPQFLGPVSTVIFWGRPRALLSSNNSEVLSKSSGDMPRRPGAERAAAQGTRCLASGAPFPEGRSTARAARLSRHAQRSSSPPGSLLAPRRAAPGDAEGKLACAAPLLAAHLCGTEAGARCMRTGQP